MHFIFCIQTLDISFDSKGCYHLFEYYEFDVQQCLMEMTKHAPFLYTTEIENLSQLCYRAFDNSNYDVRCTVAKLLGTVLATTQNPPKEFAKGKSVNSYW